jgi:predicted esterase
MFQKSGWDHRFVPFRGGHGIGPNVVSALGEFLAG